MIYTIANTSKAGRPVKVFVNGNLIEKVVMADTVKGIVEYIPDPPRAKKGADCIYTRKLKGVVTVEPVNP